MLFYSYVCKKGNYIYEKGYRDGKPFKNKIMYKPYLFVDSKYNSEYKTIKDRPVTKMSFDSMSEAKAFTYKYKDIKEFKIYGLTNFEFTYIYDTYEKDFEYDYSLLNVVNTDIETDSSGGFPDIHLADKEINAITLAKKGKTVSLGFHEYHGTKTYIKCIDEKDLLRKFLDLWVSKEWNPDIITGWNIEFFDIPYIINRITRVLGEDEANRLSPFKIIDKKEITQKTGKIIDSYTIFGVAIIDYYAAYKKFATNERESYKLDYIAEYELKENKLDYSEYKNLDELYRMNFTKYIDYNVHDAVLIERLENKLHYIEQIVNIAYIERVNFENTLSTVKPWDVIIHNYLMDQKIVVPHFDVEETNYKIEGGYVKEPVPGYYKNVVVVDFTSLYPSLCIQYNISPDTFVKQLEFNKSDVQGAIDKINNHPLEKLTEKLKEHNYTMTANGCLFKRDYRGFLPSLMKQFFDERTKTRKLESIANKKYRETNSSSDENQYLKYKNLQTAYKLINNSGYGAIANRYLRWFANYLGEGITLSGQMTTQWVETKVNEYLNKKFKTEDQTYVVYCDTDSAYITLDALVGDMETIEAIKYIEKYCVEVLCPYIDSVCLELANKLNAFEFKTSMKLEKICDQAFFTRKKRYALNVIYDEEIYNDPGKLKVIGLETVRSSVPKHCRKALEECFKIVFKGDRDKMLYYVDEFKEKFYKMKFDEIGKPSSVRGLEKYYNPITLVNSHCPIHVRASLVYNEFIKKNKLQDKYSLIVDYDKVKVCYIKLPNPTFNNVIAFKDDIIPEELDILEFIDYDLQFDKNFMDPLRNVCEIVKWDFEKVYSLNDVFGD
jgi:DNA polymerase elongation subunit (family B)